MIDHKRVHSDKMEYNCHTCGQQFKWKLQLERHMMDHTGVSEDIITEFSTESLVPAEAVPV